VETITLDYSRPVPPRDPYSFVRRPPPDVPEYLPTVWTDENPRPDFIEWYLGHCVFLYA